MRSTDDVRQAAVNGDPTAMRAVVTELLPRVRNLVRYLVRGDADVDDIAQEALVTIITGLPSHRGDGPLTAWADRVTTRSTFAYLRRARRGRARVEEEPELSTVPAPDGRPDDYTERRRAVALLDQLPDEQRHALVLHHVVGMTVPEIATVLGVPFETVRSRLRIGIGKLRALC